MARRYWTKCTATVAEGDSLHASWMQEGILGNAEAALEEARWDYCWPIVGGISIAGVGLIRAWGPVVVPVYFDRDAVLRSIYVEICADRGSAAPDRDFYAVLADGWREPDHVDTGVITINDPSVTWAVTDTSPTWQPAKEITMPRSASGRQSLVYEDPREGEATRHARYAWLSVWVDDPIIFSPDLLGVRAYESVEV